jgi:hypothetical protein
MKKALAKGLIVIIEAGIDVLAEKVKKRRKSNGNSDGLDHLRNRRGVYDLPYQSTAHNLAVGRWLKAQGNSVRGRFISWE